jgi:hypothetical protein
MIYNDNKQDTKDIKKFIKPQNPWKQTEKTTKSGLTEQRPNPGSPSARVLPIRGQK